MSKKRKKFVVLYGSHEHPEPTPIGYFETEAEAAEYLSEIFEDAPIEYVINHWIEEIKN